jgi:hypothetical protein
MGVFTNVSMSVSWGRGTVHGWDGWWIRRGALELGLVPQVGGRLMGMRWRGHELAFVHPDHAGRVLDVASFRDVRRAKRDLGFVHWGGDKTWLAPQEHWTDAIPFLDLDAGAYALEVEEATAERVRVVMRSAVCRESGARLARRITVDEGAAHFTVEHVMENASAAPITWGLWDVHQVNAPGIAYLPRRERSAYRDGVEAFPAEGDSEGARADVLRPMGGVVAIDCRRPRWFKFGVDADEGWALGVVETSGGLVGYRKEVPVVAGAAYGHGCVSEVYDSPHFAYFELESHGPVVTLAPGESTALVERRRVCDVAAWPVTEGAVRALC